jgi:cytochrome b pre-mRNA-processing protein 3
MLTRLMFWRDRQQKARSLYGSIVTQARWRGFYAHWGVPDTAEGRFEMIVLHLVIVLRRLGREGQAGQRLAQALTEAFIVDLDDNLREMTVGDLAVPRHVKRGVGALHERYVSYGAALAAADEGLLTAALQTRLRAVDASASLEAGRICAYIRRVSHRLDLLTGAEVLAGCIAWPQIGPQVDGAARDAQPIGG